MSLAERYAGFDPVLHRYGSDSLLIDLADGPSPDLARQACIWHLDEVIATWPEVVETVPAVNNLLVVCRDADAVARISERLRRGGFEGDAGAVPGRDIAIPVHYGGIGGPDLTAVAAHCGLSVKALVEAHSAAVYTVLCLGAHPGFGYLAGLPAALSVPRRASPRARVEAGSVAIGGSQAGVIAAPTPSGWNLIGRTELTFFDLQEQPPNLLRPGDRLRFEIADIRS
ncbi:MAG: 5-oxoprolinase subunit PxpB [Salinicola sp.]|uniref:5-oxoprolinase subunit PxpB n=1 Tax=Salinicola sp. TaxID=1978524 RepID=UPI001E01BDBA|nr:5-oxoprolinase subunit PxpB [Salinicola sp.]NRB54453.1 5-oxoprolinase subunit PxpB [Salinicola sp.]